jgi:uncharacterized protein
MEAEYSTRIPRDAQERNGKIRTFTGLYVNPLKLRATDIRIADTAHHLSNICRYTGACPAHYNVAHHSILVARRLMYWGAPPQLQLAGLLHDAAESYFNDLASPVKHDPRMKWYRDMEHEATRMIFCVFGLDPDLLPATKEADDAVFRDEVATWWGGADLIRPMAPQPAERLFLSTFNDLRERICENNTADRFHRA